MIFLIFRKARKKNLALFLCILLPFSLFAQETSREETSTEDEFYDDEYFYLFEDDDGLTISAAPETSQQIEVIEKEEIEKHTAPDLASLLQETLHLGITRYGGRGNMSGINMRGFDSKRVALLVDGIPVNSAIDGKIDIDQIDLNSVERIEVIYGGSDSKYNVSGALGGVINIITVKKRESGFRFGGSASNTSAMPGVYFDRKGEKQTPHWEDLADSQNLSLFANYGRESFSAAVNLFAARAANHFLFQDDIDKTRRKDNNEVWDTGADVSAVWEFPSLAKLIASSKFYYGDKNIPSSGFSSFFGKQRDISTRHSVMLDAPRAFHDELAAEASLTYSFSDREYVSPLGAESVHDLHNVMAINRWNWFPTERITMRTGFDYRFNFLDSTEIASHVRHDGGIYLTAELKPLDKLMLIPSLKALITSGGITPVPKLGFLVTVNDSFSIRNNYFRSFKLPDFEDLYWQGGEFSGNPSLIPEDGWGGDIGTEWRFKDLFVLENVFFTQWTQNSIHWAEGINGTWRPENVGEAIFFGLENKITFNIPVSFGPITTLKPSLSYQYLLSYLLSYGYDFASDKRIPYMPAHTLGGSLEIIWKTGSLIISAHFESLRYADTANLSALDPYFLLNMNLNQKIENNFSMFAALRNITNESYESFSGYPMPGIMLTLGLKTQFERNNKTR
jgi:vitamin B12 transporter